MAVKKIESSLEALQYVQALIEYVDTTMTHQNVSLANAMRSTLHGVHTAVFDANNDERNSVTERLLRNRKA